jgi:subtilisin-like proprotein convertase family protein
MVSTNRRLRGVVALACLALMVGFQLPSNAAPRRARAQESAKDALVSRLIDLDTAINVFKERLAADPTNTRLRNKLNAATAEYEAISLQLGGDQAPNPITEATTPPGAGQGQGTPIPPNCAAGATGTGTNATPLPIPDSGGATVSSAITIMGAGPYLWDLNMVTNITHTFPGDLDFTLTSPAGTIVTVSSDNASTNDNVFAGTTWDDDASPGGQVPYTTTAGVVGDHPYAVGVVATPLAPEEAFAAFIGEDPNGTWTLTLDDDAGGDTGTLNSWSLSIVTLAAPPMNAAPIMGANNTPLPIPDSGGATVSSTITIMGAATFLCDVNMMTNITHTFPGDLDMTLTSPAGTIVSFSTDNASTNDNVFAGTTWDDDADPDGQVPYVTNAGLANDHNYAVGVVATPLAPEEPFSAFIGEDPNGVWTLTLDDDAGGDTGTLNSWSLSIVTCMCQVVQGCMVICPPPQNVAATDPGGAIVNYPAPTTAGECGPVTCTPASGSFFPVGTTTVTCTETASAESVTTVYSSGNIAVPIPASGTAGEMTPQVINVADPGTVTDVNVRIRLNHTFDGDLSIRLQAPNGAIVSLAENRGGSGDNFGSGATDCTGTKTVFDDEAATAISAGAAPFAGSFRPETPLTGAEGIPAAGNWTLLITDEVGGDLGTLFCYELEITRLVAVAGASCSFPVTVAIPFDAMCCVDDATGSTFRQVVANSTPGSPLYGFWEYFHAPTGETFSGVATYVAYRPGLSLVMRDSTSPNVALYAQIDFIRRTCVVQVIDRQTGRTFVLRDRNTADSMCGVQPANP